MTTTAEEGQSWSSSSSSADNKLCCGDQKYNYFVRIYFCIIIPQTHTTRTTDAMLTMSRRALIVAAVLLVDLANHPAIAQLLPAQEGRECELSCWLVGRKIPGAKRRIYLSLCVFQVVLVHISEIVGIHLHIRKISLLDLVDLFVDSPEQF